MQRISIYYVIYVEIFYLMSVFCMSGRIRRMFYFLPIIYIYLIFIYYLRYKYMIWIYIKLFICEIVCVLKSSFVTLL